MHELDLLLGLEVVAVQVGALQAHVVLLYLLLRKLEVHSTLDGGSDWFFRSEIFHHDDLVSEGGRAVIAVVTPLLLLVFLKILLLYSRTVLHVATVILSDYPKSIIRLI